MTSTYYAYSFQWKRIGQTNWYSSFGVHKGTILELYEFAQNQEEDWAICSFVEISQSDFDNSDLG